MKISSYEWHADYEYDHRGERFVTGYSMTIKFRDSELNELKRLERVIRELDGQTPVTVTIVPVKP